MHLQQLPQSARCNAGCLTLLLCAVQLDQSKMLIFGGVNHRTRYDDLWMLNLVEKSWTQVKPDGKGPAARAHHSATKCGNKIFVFGGYGGNGRCVSSSTA